MNYSVTALLMLAAVMQAAAAGKDVLHAKIYVSTAGRDENAGTFAKPFATLSRAQQAVRQIRIDSPDKDVTVYLRKGTYHISEPVVFGPEDGGDETSQVVYQSYPGERAVISGGEKITGWKYDKSKKLWYVRREDLSGVTDLYSENKRLTRARWPENGDYVVVMDVNEAARKVVIDRPIPFEVSDVSVKFVAVHMWSASHIPVKQARGTHVEAAFMAVTGNRSLLIEKGRKAYFENVLWSVDQPGEFAFDVNNRTLYAKFDKKFNPNKTPVFLPKTEQLVVVKGKKSDPVNNLHFRDINFRYANWVYPLGFRGYQAGHYYLEDESQKKQFVIPAVDFSYTQNSSIAGCQIIHCGGSGMGFGPGSMNNSIVGCEIADVGGNGVMIGYRTVEDINEKGWDYDWQDGNDVPVSNEVSHNWIRQAGQNHIGAVGVWQAFSAKTRITNNLIEDLPYTGISAGFKWHDVPTSNRENLIAYNEVRNVMSLLYDGGAIYTLGNQPGTVIKGNYLHHVLHGQGIYTDVGSSDLLIEGNVVFKIQDCAFQSHRAHSNTLRNNIFASAKLYYVRKIPISPREAFWLDRNIFWMDGGKLIDGMLEDGKFRFTNNIYWLSTGAYPMQFTDYTFGALPVWQKLGQDINGLFIDPKFECPAQGNFTMPSDSPALKAGFNQIDVSLTGPQGQWKKVLKGYSK